MLKFILGMLTMLISKVSVVNLLKNATENFLNATTDEEKQAAKIKLIACNLLFMSKFEDELNDEVSSLIMKELSNIVDSIKLEDYTEEEKTVLTSEMADRIIKKVAEEEDLEEEDAEFHVHDCDTCQAKGNCPIEGVMRDVNSGKLTPEEGEEAATSIIEGLENPTKKFILPTVVAEA